MTTVRTVLLLLPALIASTVQAAAPTLTRLEPSGAARGTQVDVTAIGTFSQWPMRCWVEGKGITVEPLKEKGKLRFSVAADATPGPRWVRVFGDDGATEARPFIIGTLREVAEVEPNDQVSDAQKCESSALVVNGKLGRSGDVDSYALALKKGQTLVAAIASRKAFGSPMDGVLQVVSPAGFVLAQNDDDGDFDPLLTWTAPSDGRYLVRVFAFPATPDSSIRFAGGEGYLYRLTLTTGPYLDQTMPLVLGAGTRELEPVGWNLPKTLTRLAPLDSTDPSVAVIGSAEFANVIEVSRSVEPTVTEIEPSSAEKPQMLTWPVSVTGRIDSPSDRDVFQINVKKNVRLQIKADARKHGSPLDPTIKILDPSGATVLELDDSSRGGRDIDATFTPTQDGPYRLIVADLHRRGGSRFLYALSIGQPRVDVTLKLAEQRLVLKPGTLATLKIDLTRLNGFDRAVEVRAVGLPATVKVAPVTSAAKGDTAKSVTLKFEASTGPFSGPFRVEGVEPDGAKRVHVAHFAVADVERPLLDAFLTVTAPPAPAPPPPKPKPEEKPKPKEEPKPKPKVEEKPKPKTAAKASVERHWAFEPLKTPGVPRIASGIQPGNPIDAFLLKALEAQGLKPAAESDRRTLIRRVTLDLTGLPPTPEDVRSFLADTRPDAYERLVDGLLARPEHGERWARHWFDVVRYAESNGYERDGAKPGSWRYRDYVIKALNQDRPFDRFLLEQVAGDELDDASPETRTATTFLRLGTWDDEPADDLVDRYDQLDDVLGTVATGFLGLTLRCARCHDHKFEPFSQAEYYQMLAVFEPLKRPQVGREEYEWPTCSPQEWNRYQADSARTYGRNAAFSLGANVAARRPLDPPPTAYIWKEAGPKPPPTHLLRRGDPTRRGELVSPGVPGALRAPISGEPRPTEASAGRRLWLAKWMVSPENPLTARVIANRLWQWHFGRGIVASSNDFGTMGDPPTHPELLDWLASELIHNRWRMKAIHRQIVLSDAYRRAGSPAADEPTYQSFPSRRLEAEAIRDSVLAVSGALNRERGGPSVYPEIPRAVLEGQSRPGEGWGKSSEHQAARRSVYVFAKRSLAIPELELLDTPDTTSSCESRPHSTTGPQALTFLNGAFINDQAKRFAGRLSREAMSAQGRVERAFELAVSRPPTHAELAASLAFLKKQTSLIASESPRDDAGAKALESFCLVMLNLNDFVTLK